MSSMSLAPSQGSGLGLGWHRSPESKEASPPVHIDSSGRPILCMSVSNTEAVVGSSDHALYAYDLLSGAQSRQMYDGRNGHREWVTCVAHASDGRIVSGGMDAKLLIWGARGGPCYELKGHTASVSAVECSRKEMFAVSASYDKTVRVWNLQSRRQVSCLVGHKAPVLNIDLAPGLALTGSRNGLAIAWDISSGTKLATLKGHKGHVTAVSWLRPSDATLADPDDLSPYIFMSGAQDGHVRVWDLRDKREVANVAVHTSSRGAGAIAGLGVTSDLRTVVSAGADRKVCMLDVRSGFKVRHRATEHKDFIYELKVIGDLAISGGGDGTLWCHSGTEDRGLWSIKPLDNAIRCIGNTQNRLIIAGDDGSAIIHTM